jgi:RNA polymerase sigma factor (sigma-70 family)
LLLERVPKSEGVSGRRQSAHLADAYRDQFGSQVFQESAIAVLATVERSALDPALIGDLLPDRKISPEARALVNEQVQAVWDATEGLADRQRTVFLLRFMEDMTIAEIAAAAGLTENAVNVHLFRAVRGVFRSFQRSALLAVPFSLSFPA